MRNWDVLIETTTRVLVEVAKEYSEELASDENRLTALAGDVVGYVKLRYIGGDEQNLRNAGRILKLAKQDASAVARRYSVKRAGAFATYVHGMAMSMLALMRGGAFDFAKPEKEE